MARRNLLVAVTLLAFVGFPGLPASTNVNETFTLADASMVGTNSAIRIKRLIGSNSNLSFYIEAVNDTDRLVTLIARRGDWVQTSDLYQDYIVAAADATRPAGAVGIVGVQTATAADFTPSRDEYRWDFKPHETRTIRINALCINFEKDPLPDSYDGEFVIGRYDHFDKLFRAVDRANDILSDPLRASSNFRVSMILKTALRINRRFTVNPSVHNVAIWMSQGVTRDRMFEKLVRPTLRPDGLNEMRVEQANSVFDAAEQILDLR